MKMTGRKILLAVLVAVAIAGVLYTADTIPQGQVLLHIPSSNTPSMHRKLPSKPKPSKQKSTKSKNKPKKLDPARLNNPAIDKALTMKRFMGPDNVESTVNRLKNQNMRKNGIRQKDNKDETNMGFNERLNYYATYKRPKRAFQNENLLRDIQNRGKAYNGNQHITAMDKGLTQARTNRVKKEYLAQNNQRPATQVHVSGGGAPRRRPVRKTKAQIQQERADYQYAMQLGGLAPPKPNVPKVPAGGGNGQANGGGQQKQYQIFVSNPEQTALQGNIGNYPRNRQYQQGNGGNGKVNKQYLSSKFKPRQQHVGQQQTRPRRTTMYGGANQQQQNAGGANQQQQQNAGGANQGQRGRQKDASDFFGSLNGNYQNSHGNYHKYNGNN